MQVRAPVSVTAWQCRNILVQEELFSKPVMARVKALSFQPKTTDEDVLWQRFSLLV